MTIFHCKKYCLYCQFSSFFFSSLILFLSSFGSILSFNTNFHINIIFCKCFDVDVQCLLYSSIHSFFMRIGNWSRATYQIYQQHNWNAILNIHEIFTAQCFGVIFSFHCPIHSVFDQFFCSDFGFCFCSSFSIESLKLYTANALQIRWNPFEIGLLKCTKEII